MAGAPAWARVRSDDPVHLLMRMSSDRAFAKLVQPDGVWSSPGARITMPVMFARPGNKLEGPLRSPQFRETLQHRLNNMAEAGARKAGPLVTKKIRSLNVPDPAGDMLGETQWQWLEQQLTHSDADMHIIGSGMMRELGLRILHLGVTGTDRRLPERHRPVRGQLASAPACGLRSGA